MPVPDRPAHRSPRLLAVVAVGGGLGSGARYAVGALLPTTTSWPVSTFVVNVVGAFCLGVLLAALAASTANGRDRSGRRTVLRLGLGTGLLGGFTTFSSLALEVERLLAGGDVVPAAGYALASVVVGLAAAWAGMWTGGALGRRRAEVR